MAGVVTSIVAVPGWWARVADAERDSQELIARPEVLTACTHVADSIVVVTVETSDEELSTRWDTRHRGGAYGARSDAIWRHGHRTGGRLFAFPGSEALHGTMSVQELTDRSAIEQVVVAGRVLPLTGECTVSEAAGLRPVYRGGRCQLVVRPVGPRYVPWDGAKARA